MNVELQEGQMETTENDLWPTLENNEDFGEEVLSVWILLFLLNLYRLGTMNRSR